MSRAFATADSVDVEERADPTFSVGYAALSEFLGRSGSTSVKQNAALGLSAVYRSLVLISGTVGRPAAQRAIARPTPPRPASPASLDDPGGATGLTSFEWCELVLNHPLLNGNAYLLQAYGGAGQIVGLQPIVPSGVAVEPDDQFGKLFKSPTAG